MFGSARRSGRRREAEEAEGAAPPAEGALKAEGAEGEAPAKKKMSGQDACILFIVLPAVLVLGGSGAAAVLLLGGGGGEQHAEKNAGHGKGKGRHGQEEGRRSHAR